MSVLKKKDAAVDNLQYLSMWRRRPSTAVGAASRDILEQAQSDRSRVLFSSSFRRLAQKTQVFALESAEVRSRMTHSLEVASIGMYLIEMVFKLLDAQVTVHGQAASWRHLSPRERNAIRSFVETACLVHDLGNPPFGHFGEKAIRGWFVMRSGDAWFKEGIATKGTSRDFLCFDGNMQGFRILTRLQRNLDDPFGMNLTGTQLAAAVKYPIPDPAKPTKCGYFEAEAAIKQEVWKALGLASAARHPCSLLMEAADDIAYCMSDLEDAYEKGLLTPSDLQQAFGTTETFSAESGDFTRVRTKFTNDIVEETAQRFVERLNGTEAPDKAGGLLKGHTKLKTLRDTTSAKVYSAPIVLANELTGFSVIHGLLDKFACLFKMQADDFATLVKRHLSGQSFYTDDIKDVTARYTQEVALISRMSRKYLSVYLDSLKENLFPEMFYRVHAVVDQIAGMTDHFALETYRLMSGQVLYGHRN